MAMVASRELRNDTAGVLRRVREGEEITVTVRGEPVAQIVPIRPERSRRRPMSGAELFRRLRDAQADPGLRDDLAWLASDTTDVIPLR